MIEYKIKKNENGTKLVTEKWSKVCANQKNFLYASLNGAALKSIQASTSGNNNAEIYQVIIFLNMIPN